jgi:hypothetical protein
MTAEGMKYSQRCGNGANRKKIKKKWVDLGPKNSL